MKAESYTILINGQTRGMYSIDITNIKISQRTGQITLTKFGETVAILPANTIVFKTGEIESR